MIYLKKQINSISITDSNFVFDLKGKTKNVEFDLFEIKNIFIGFKKVSYFYFFDLISFLVILISLVLTFYFSNSKLFFGGIVILFLRGVYLVHNTTYFVTIELKNKISHDFYLSNNKKSIILEKIKIIRGKITEINFNIEKEKKTYNNIKNSG